MAEFHLKFHHCIQKKEKKSKQQNKLILGINLLISKPWVVLKISTFSMTSTDMITSVASLTSTASLISKNQKLHALYILSNFPYIGNLSSFNDINRLNNLNNQNSLNSLISSKDLLILMFSSILAPVLVEWISKNPLFLLIFGDLSVGGCGGHGFYFQPNPRVISEMFIANERTNTFFIA